MNCVEAAGSIKRAGQANLRPSVRGWGMAGAILAACGFAFASTAQPPQDGQGGGVPPGHSADDGHNHAAQPAPIPVPDGPVVSTENRDGGVLVEDITIGTGYEVPLGGAVVAHYHGTLKDGGKEFDSSFKRGEPVAFPLNGVIEGWQKGVPGMKVGGVRRLTIPSALGYGAQGAGQDIPGNADLVFVIQLVAVLETQDITVGTGEEATAQCVAVTSHTVKNEKGEVVEARDAAHPYIWLPGEHQGVGFGLEGMKEGGKRRLIVPKEMSLSAPGSGNALPQNEKLEVEIELISVRNLGPRRR